MEKSAVESAFENIRGCSTHATGYLSRNIDLKFVVLFYLCVLVVIFCNITLGFEVVVLFIVLFAKNCTNQIKSNYLNSHREEAQKKPRYWT